MVGKGAPKENQYAAKPGGKGVGITTYLSQKEVAALQRYLRRKGHDASKWRKAAHELAKYGIFSQIKDDLEPDIL